MLATARETNDLAGRPEKFPGQKLVNLNAKVPEAMRDYIQSKRPVSQTDVMIGYIKLDQALEALRQDLRASAALNDEPYDTDRTETIIRLLKLGLKAEKSRK